MERTESLRFWSILGPNLLLGHSMAGDASLDSLEFDKNLTNCYNV